MAKAKFWVIEGVNEVIKGYYTAGKGKTAAIESIDGKVYELRCQFKGYTSESEACQALKGSGAASKVASSSGSSFSFEPGTYIGSDEVGKIEPLKQVMVVAVYASADKFAALNELGVDDSKKLKNKIGAIGKELTGFESYTDIESGKVYENEKYGLSFCPVILTNAQYNAKHDIMNANEALTELHNAANMALYNHLKSKNIQIKGFIIDDYMNGYGDKKFKSYLDNLSGITEKITDQTGLLAHFEKKADGIYKEIVGTASDICAYMDLLWQEYLNAKYGMELDYGNDVKTKATLIQSFNRIKEIDEDMLDVKHTQTYEDWKKITGN